MLFELGFYVNTNALFILHVIYIINNKICLFYSEYSHYIKIILKNKRTLIKNDAIAKGKHFKSNPNLFTRTNAQLLFHLVLAAG